MKIEGVYSLRVEEGDQIAFEGKKKLWIRDGDRLYTSETITSLDQLYLADVIPVMGAGRISQDSDLIKHLTWQEYIPKISEPQQSLNPVQESPTDGQRSN